MAEKEAVLKVEVVRPKAKVFDLGVIELDLQTTIINSFEMPFDGYITRVDASWPAGALNAIGFKIMIGGIKLIPANPEVYYIADNDVSIPFLTIYRVAKGEIVTAEIRNESTTTALDLQVRVTVTNFDPRLMGMGGI